MKSEPSFEPGSLSGDLHEFDHNHLATTTGLGLIHEIKCNSTLGESSVNTKDLQALTLVRPPRDNKKSDPLAVLHLDN